MNYIETGNVTPVAPQDQELWDIFPRYIKSLGLGLIAESKHDSVGAMVAMLTSGAVLDQRLQAHGH